MDTSHHLFFIFVIPLTQRHPSVEIVGADEYDDGIYRVAMLSLALMRLTRHVVPLPPAHAIDVGLHLQPVIQKSPVLFL